MTAYTITNRVSGAELGIYEGETPEAAIAAMHLDAGYDSTEAAADALGVAVDELIAELDVTEVDESDDRAYMTIVVGYDESAAAFASVEQLADHMRLFDPNLSGATIRVIRGEGTYVECDADPIAAAGVFRSVCDVIDSAQQYRACYVGDCVLTGPEHSHLDDDGLRAEAMAEVERAGLDVSEDELEIGTWAA